MRDVYVTGDKVFGEWLYRVMVDGKVYDSFFSPTPLTNSDMIDVATSYREGLTALGR